MALGIEEFRSKRRNINALQWRGEALRGAAFSFLPSKAWEMLSNSFDICRYWWNGRPTSLFSQPQNWFACCGR